MVAGKETDWKFAEDFIVEPDDIALARTRSTELGVEAITPAMGAQLAVLAAATVATTMIEVGTGAGVSGLWLLAGAPQATLTSIDIEAEHQQHARASFQNAGYPDNRIRLITGRAREVLPRMNEGAYDVVFIDADPQSVIEYVEHGLRLVRAGGTVIVAHVLWHSRVADPAHRDDVVAGFRSLLRELSTSTAVISAISPVGDGLLLLTAADNG